MSDDLTYIPGRQDYKLKFFIKPLDGKTPEIATVYWRGNVELSGKQVTRECLEKAVDGNLCLIPSGFLETFLNEFASMPVRNFMRSVITRDGAIAVEYKVLLSST